MQYIPVYSDVSMNCNIYTMQYYDIIYGLSLVFIYYHILHKCATMLHAMHHFWKCIKQNAHELTCRAKVCNTDRA